MRVADLQTIEPAGSVAVARRPAPAVAHPVLVTVLRTLRHLAVVLAAAAAYRLVRASTGGDHDQALANGARVLAVERRFGVDIERSVQAHALTSRTLVDVANTIYTWGFWSIVAVTLLVLFVRDRARFRLYRNALFVSGAVGLAVFAAFPAAPPRMLDGFVDTINDFSGSGGIAHPGSFTNVYAAMPSFHVGWLVLAGVASMSLVPVRLLRPVLLAPSLVMLWTVIATANHYLLDGIAGALIAIGGLVVARWLPAVGTHIRRFEARCFAPWGGVSGAAARLGEVVGRGFVPFIGGRAAQAYQAALTTTRRAADVTRRRAV